jgi:hypothetical protein
MDFNRLTNKKVKYSLHHFKCNIHLTLYCFIFLDWQEDHVMMNYNNRVTLTTKKVKYFIFTVTRKQFNVNVNLFFLSIFGKS